MALTRKFLSAMGIEPDKVDEIINAHAETVDGLKEQLQQYKESADKLPEVQKELDKLKESTKNGGDYDRLKQEFEDYKAEVKNKETLNAKKAALSKVAKDAGLSEAGVAKAVKYADWSAIELDDDGNVKEAKNLIKSLREEWSEHIVKTETKGADTATPPQNSGTGKYKNRSEIMAIKDTTERQKAIAENLQLFNGGK